MIDKISHVRNPLTVIAMFAGIAEVSGTVVLPFLSEDTQSIYVWFLMIFPCILVFCFFGVLLLKAQALYAPSDYKDENLFAQAFIFQPPTKRTRAEKLKEGLSGDSVGDHKSLNNGNIPSKLADPDLSTETVANTEIPSAAISEENNIYTEGKLSLARDMVTTYLSEKYRIPFLLNVSPANRPNIAFDAVGTNRDTQYIAEIRYADTGILPDSHMNKIRERFEDYWGSLSPYQKECVIFFLIVVTGTDDRFRAKLAKERIFARMAGVPFPVEMEVFTLDQLQSLIKA